MPGDISQSYNGPPICRCEHFKDCHDFDQSFAPCTVDDCLCMNFEEAPFDDSEFGKDMNEFIGYRPEEQP